MKSLCFPSAILLLLLLCAPAGAQQPAVDPQQEAGGEAEEWTDFEDPFAEEEEELTVYDPIEPFNRGVFWVNDKLYFYLFKPVARGLRVVPEPARVSVSNFFSNLATPIRFVNATLQLKGGDASRELVRFLINTTLGLGGLFDVAAEHGGIYKKKEDLGQTLGHYGVGPGFYLVLPVLGPSNLRDTVGLVGDRYVDPLTYLFDFEDRMPIRAGVYENELSLDEDTYEDIKKQALDPYLFVRNAYAQRRQGLIAK